MSDHICHHPKRLRRRERALERRKAQLARYQEGDFKPLTAGDLNPSEKIALAVKEIESLEAKGAV